MRLKSLGLLTCNEESSRKVVLGDDAPSRKIWVFKTGHNKKCTMEQTQVFLQDHYLCKINADLALCLFGPRSLRMYAELWPPGSWQTPRKFADNEWTSAERRLLLLAALDNIHVTMGNLARDVRDGSRTFL